MPNPHDEYDLDLKDSDPTPEVGNHPNNKGRGKPDKKVREEHDNDSIPDETGMHGKKPE